MSRSPEELDEYHAEKIEQYIYAFFPFNSNLQRRKNWLIKQDLILRAAALGILDEELRKKIDVKLLTTTVRSIRETMGIAGEKRGRPAVEKQPGDDEDFDPEHRREIERAMTKTEEGENGRAGTPTGAGAGKTGSASGVGVGSQTG